MYGKPSVTYSHTDRRHRLIDICMQLPPVGEQRYKKKKKTEAMVACSLEVKHMDIYGFSYQEFPDLAVLLT